LTDFFKLYLLHWEFTIRFGTYVDVKTAVTTDGGGPLQFTPVPFALDCVLNPLGEWGDESDDRNDDGIEALLMSLSIAQPGSFFCVFVFFCLFCPIYRPMD
jgi:hypothetical protein